MGEEALYLGVDVGGTFTDIVIVGSGAPCRAKVPTTPANPGIGVMHAIDLAASVLDLGRSAMLRRLGRFGLGTTMVTNVLATRTGRQLGLITTKGFEDLVPLARGNRESDHGWLVPPPSLVDRTRIVGVAERTTRDGTITTRLDPRDAVAAVDWLMRTGPLDAVVVSFLWSFHTPTNEQVAAEAIAASFPDVKVVCGSDLAPVIREFERTQFALLNAYVDGALDWLDDLGDALGADGMTCPLVLTHSSGGVTTVAAARRAPIGLAQSGPAAGGAAAIELARLLGESDAVTCDLGGTSLDVALISEGRLLRRNRGAIVGHWTALSMVDVDSVGSGGGSIAWIDAVGAIRVGPRSAGAHPGPACYGRGGTEATVTDALVVLGYIDPAGFLGGSMPLDAAAAHDACARLGEPLGMDGTETAWGIREVALASMARAVRARIAGRGLAAADLALIAYGGCGGLFAVDIAADVGATRVVVPELAPVFSAYGAASAPMRRERARSVALRLPDTAGVLSGVLAALRNEVVAELQADGGDGVDGGDRANGAMAFEADVRFERQGAEITIPVSLDNTPGGDALEDRFRAEYRRRFGDGAVAMGVNVEVMTVRAVFTETMDVTRRATAPMPDSGPGSGGAVGEPPPRHSRLVHRRRGGPAEFGVCPFDSLRVGESVEGPAIIDAGDTAIAVAQGWTATLESSGAVVIIEESS